MQVSFLLFKKIKKKKRVNCQCAQNTNEQEIRGGGGD